MKLKPQTELPLADAGSVETRECSGAEFLALGEQASKGKLRILVAERDWRKGRWRVTVRHCAKTPSSSPQRKDGPAAKRERLSPQTVTLGGSR